MGPCNPRPLRSPLDPLPGEGSWKTTRRVGRIRPSTRFVFLFFFSSLKTKRADLRRAKVASCTWALRAGVKTVNGHSALGRSSRRVNELGIGTATTQRCCVESDGGARPTCSLFRSATATATKTADGAASSKAAKTSRGYKFSVLRYNAPVRVLTDYVVIGIGTGTALHLHRYRYLVPYIRVSTPHTTYLRRGDGATLKLVNLNHQVW